MVYKDFIIFKNGFIACKIKNSKNVSLQCSSCEIKPFWKQWTKSTHKDLTQSHSQDMWKRVSKTKTHCKYGIFSSLNWHAAFSELRRNQVNFLVYEQDKKI